MHGMNFIHVYSKSDMEEELLIEIWNMLGGTEHNFIKAENLFIVLAGILNIQHPDLIHSHDKEFPTDHTSNRYICFDSLNNAHFTSI